MWISRILGREAQVAIRAEAVLPEEGPPAADGLAGVSDAVAAMVNGLFIT